MKTPSAHITRFLAFWQVPQHVFWLGIVATLVITTMEFLHHGAENYIDFRDATLNFWQGISSYTPEYSSAHGRYFLYTPVFNLLFTPFAFLPFRMGGYAWNLFGYCLFYAGVRLLPTELRKHTAQIWLYLLLWIGQTLFCFQFNLPVVAIFVLSFALLERDRAFWAVLLIMLSATCKIYGIVELALLLCYPKFWRNMGYAILTGTALLLLPIVKLGIHGFLPWYQDWLLALTDHHETTGIYYSLIFAQPLRAFALPYMRWFQGAVLLVQGIAFFCARKRWGDLRFRVGALAGLMIYIVIMSEAAEYTTHIISATGFALWYFSKEQHSVFDKVLFWSIWLLWGVMPIDIFCPSPLCNYIHGNLWIGVYVLLIGWCRLLYDTLTYDRTTEA